MSTRTSRRTAGRTQRQRVRWLVTHFAQDSIRLAAELWGVRRLTLLRVIQGRVRAPRGRVLERIADACGTTVDWLRTGQGSPPALPGPEAILFTPWRSRWRIFIESLRLPEAVAARLVELPGVMQRVFHVLVLAGHPLGVPIRGMEVLRRAEEFEYRAWLALLTGLIETYGRDRVRAKLAAEQRWLELQFNPVAIWRYREDRVAERAPKDPVRLDWEDTLRLAHEGSPGLPIHAPSLAAEGAPPAQQPESSEERRGNRTAGLDSVG